MTDCIGEAEMYELLEDLLDRRREARVNDHLESCKVCRETLQSLAVQGESFEAFESELTEFGSTIAGAKYSKDTLLQVETARFLLNASEDPAAMGRLGRFDVFSIVGIGSTGFVYKGFDRSLHRPVALKLLAPGLAHLVASRQRFEREGRAIALVRDPHVVDVYGVEAHGELPVIVMRYVSGESLQKRIDQHGELSCEQVIRLGVQIAKGLAAAHAQGIIHRDIKPSNILLETGSDRAIVSDFGLAHVAGDVGMTRTGMIAGTPQFMSPEQAEGRSVDERSDLFSLGCVLYACCAGEPPFAGYSIMGVLRQVADGEPPALRTMNPNVPHWLEAFIAKLMKKAPDERFQSANEVAALLSDEITHLQSPKSYPPERAWLAADASVRRFSIKMFAVAALVIGLCCCAGVLLYKSQTAGSERAEDWMSFESFEPTSAEQNIAAAKAAYDLSYETHVQEASLSGDMKESKARHLKALDLGYDPARTCFHLARANAIEGRADEAFQWFDAALEAGFCDSQALSSNSDLRKIRSDPRFKKVTQTVRESEQELDLIQRRYFIEANYSQALELAKRRLEKWPKDELSILLIAGALTELAYEDSSQLSMAKFWNQRVRSSVRYANFGSYNLGCIALMEGRLQETFDRLHYAISTGFTDQEHLVNDHMLVELVSDPRYVQLLKRFETKASH